METAGMVMCDVGQQRRGVPRILVHWIEAALKMTLTRGAWMRGKISNGGGNVSSGVEWNSLIQALLNSTAGAAVAELSTSTLPFENANGERSRAHSSRVNRFGELLFRVLEDGIGLDLSNPSPVTKNLPMVASPVPVATCVAIYTTVVWLWTSHLKNSGQKPRKEDPLPLRCLVIAHNLFLCILSLFMGVGFLSSARQLGYSIWGNVYRGDETEFQMARLVYVFYISKLYEFMDTAIMLFRRNCRQVTYLHVYHHATITCIWWIICYSCPAGDAYFSAAFNSCIHVFMYLYYLLAATVARDERSRRKYLFWGKYLTMMQMVQFVSFIAQGVYAMLFPDAYVKGVPALLFFYSVTLLAFFGNFFIKKYRIPGKIKKAD